LARKGLEETELIAAIGASEQRSTDHWTKTSLATLTSRCVAAAKFIVSYVSDCNKIALCFRRPRGAA